MVRITLFCCLLLFPWATSCNGQGSIPAPVDSTRFKDRKGLEKLKKTQGTNEYANIHCGLMDRAGNLWFGTMGEGAYRYDGKTFTQFTVADGLCNNYVYSMLQDNKGMIWFGTAYGICRYDGKGFTNIPVVVNKANSFQAYTLPAGAFTVNQHGVPDMENTVWSMMQDKKGTLWFGTTTGVYRYHGHHFEAFPHANTANRNNVQLKMVDYMLEDRHGNLWFCSGMRPGEEGICRYDGRAIEQFKPGGETWVREVIGARDGNLYFATRHKGVLKYDGKEFTNVTAKAGIDNGGVATIFEDRAGIIWLGTELGSGQLGEDGGVWRWNPSASSDKSDKSFTRFTTKDGLIHNGVFCIIEGRGGNLWFGTRDMGLSRYDGKAFTTFSE